jgi:quinol monooxygenase YgiN
MSIPIIKAVALCLAVGVGALASLSPGQARASDTPGAVVRIAELEIDPAQLEAYTAAVKEEMADAVRLEPGVLAIYAVAEKGNPTHLYFFEIYTDEAAYAAHREAPHFKRYLATTQPMITARKLAESVPVQLSSKP